MTDENGGTVDFGHLEEVTMRAFLSARMNDQARRLGLLLTRLTFGRGREGLWLRRQADLAPALAMDPSDLAKAVAKLVGDQLLVVDSRDAGFWYQLTPSRLTLDKRALVACAAIAQLEAAHVSAFQPELIVRSYEETKDGGLRQALAEVSRETAVGLRTARGEIPPDPERDVGSCPIVHSLNSPPLHTRTHARADSLTYRQIDDTNDSGAGAAVNKSRRFRDDEKNWIWEKIESLDGPGELLDEKCRNSWLGRVRDHGDLMPPLIGDIAQAQREGAVRKSALGALYVALRKAGKALGRTIKLW